MRVLQSAVTTDWVVKSQDPGGSVRAWIGGCPQHVLIDDQGLKTETNDFMVSEMTDKQSLLFYAKDSSTLIRGLLRMAKSFPQLEIKGQGDCNIAAIGVEWTGDLRHTNKLSAGMTTIGHNIRAGIMRGFAKAGGGKVRRSSSEGGIFGDGPIEGHNVSSRTLRGDESSYVYESISKNIQSAGRDGSLNSRGAAVFFCRSDLLQIEKSGKTWRNIACHMKCSEIARTAQTVLSGAYVI